MPPRSRSWMIALFVVGILALPAVAAPPEQHSPPPSRDTIAKWISQLGDRSFAAREKAADNLWHAGLAAETALRQAARSQNPEIATHARQLLDRLRYRLPPDTPPDLAKIVDQFRSGDIPAQREAAKDLFDKGGLGYVILQRLAATDQDRDHRRVVFEHVAQAACEAAGNFIVAGDTRSAGDVLDVALPCDTEQALCTYAAYHLLNGSINEQIARCRQRVEQDADPRDPKVLFYLLRAAGDLAGARIAAEKTGDFDLREAVLTDMGDWKALAAVVREAPLPGTVRDLPNGRPPDPGYKAACARLAGDDRACEAELHDLLDGSGLDAARQLLLNDHPAEAIAALRRGKEYAAAFGLLAAQLHFQEALSLAEHADPASNGERCLLQALQAKLLFQLGDDKQALAEAQKALGTALRAGDPQSGDKDGLVRQLRTLAGIQYRSGHKEEAFAYTARLIDRSKSDETGEVLAQLFPASDTAALVWWQFLRKKFPDETGPATLKRVQNLLDTKAPNADLPALAQELEQTTKNGLVGAEQKLTGLADTWLIHGKKELALAYLEKAAAVRGSSTAPLLRLGDIFAEAGEWQKAADAYDRAARKDPRQPIALHLHGWALAQLGRTKESTELIRRAHWLPLANEQLRFEYADALARHGLAEAAHAERLFLRRTGELDSRYVANVLNRFQGDALARKDYLEAADYGERVLLVVLKLRAEFVRMDTFLTAPANAHRYRAYGLLAAGRVAEARREIELSERDLPGDVELPILLLPELEKRGLQSDADRLFARTFAENDAACRQYPKSAASHNSLAWLAARCHRRLDAARAHAEKAVQLSPNTPSFLDTLAEVEFQTGHKDAAIATMKRCIELDPERDYYRKQLKRFEAGDVSADVPES